MKEYEVVAVKHNERRNGERCAMYWCINSINHTSVNDPEKIYDHWFCRRLPKRVLNVLETSPEDPEGYGEKRGQFILTLKNPITFNDFHKVKDFKDIVSIMRQDKK